MPSLLASSSRSSPTLLQLPLELRHHIYSFLLPAQQTHHPLPLIGLTASSHVPPTAALLNIHPQISDEILEYYYTITTWKLILTIGADLHRVDPDLKGLERSAALGRLRSVEIIFYCDILSLKHSAGARRDSDAVNNAAVELRKKVDRACTVLRQAEKLHTLIVSWIDTTNPRFTLLDPPNEVHWMECQSAALNPLHALLYAIPSLSFNIGKVHGPTRDWFIRVVQEVVGLERVGMVK